MLISPPQVQIHGPVSLSENVECIVVNLRHKKDSLITKLLDRFVEQNKCNLIWMDPDDLTEAVPSSSGARSHDALTGSLPSSLGATGHDDLPGAVPSSSGATSHYSSSSTLCIPPSRRSR